MSYNDRPGSKLRRIAKSSRHQQTSAFNEGAVGYMGSADRKDADA